MKLFIPGTFYNSPFGQTLVSIAVTQRCTAQYCQGVSLRWLCLKMGESKTLAKNIAIFKVVLMMMMMDDDG